MNDFLFEIPESKSPETLWRERYGFLTHFWDQADEIGEPALAWVALVPLPRDSGKDIGEILMAHSHYGSSEREAIVACALSMKIPLWNQ